MIIRGTSIGRRTTWKEDEPTARVSAHVRRGATVRRTR
jgi:hypothetical protein